MKLLSPDEVKNDKTRSESERVAHIKKLKEEELLLIRSVNDKRVQVQNEKAILDEGLGAHLRWVASEKVKLDDLISTKKREVESLESRRLEALKPINEIRKKADDRIKIAENRESAVLRDEQTLAKSWEDLSERVENVTDRETLADEKTEELATRERKIIEAESRTKESADNLAEKWLGFHKEVHDANQSLERREKKCADREKSTTAFAQSLSNKETALNAKDAQLKDGFATLDRSREEILTGKRPKS